MLIAGAITSITVYMKGLGLKTESSKPISSEGPLKGLVFVITGTLPEMSREEAQNLIESMGGKVTSSVSRKTDFLLAGENAGSKLSKANSIGIPVIDLPELKNMIL